MFQTHHVVGVQAKQFNINLRTFDYFDCNKLIINGMEYQKKSIARNIWRSSKFHAFNPFESLAMNNDNTQPRINIHCHI